MTNIISNRFFQGGIAITIIAIAFFAYQGGISTEDANETTTIVNEAAASNVTEGTTTTPAIVNTTSDNDINNDIENAVNTNVESDTINTAVEETTNK